MTQQRLDVPGHAYRIGRTDTGEYTADCECGWQSEVSAFMSDTMQPHTDHANQQGDN